MVVDLQNCLHFSAAMFLCISILFLVVTTCSGAPRTSSRILGGADADIKGFPFAASIEWVDIGHLCGAVIISAEWALTDAFCTYSPVLSEYKVRVGSAITSNSSFVSDTGTLHSVTEWIFHPLEDVLHRDYDFALVKVDPPFEFSDTVAAVELPVLNQATPNGAVGVVVGWGQKDQDGLFGPVTQLQFASMSLMSDSKCASLLGTEYNERTLCTSAANGFVALCWNDEGGPLVVDGTLFGIAFWPVSCAIPPKAQYFGRVASVRDWIDATIGVKHKDS